MIDQDFLESVVVNGIDKALAGDWELCASLVKWSGTRTQRYQIGRGRLEVKEGSVRLVADDCEIEFDEELGVIQALEVYSNSGVKILTITKNTKVGRRLNIWWYGSVDGKGGHLLEFNGYWAE